MNERQISAFVAATMVLAISLSAPQTTLAISDKQSTTNIAIVKLNDQSPTVDGNIDSVWSTSNRYAITKLIDNGPPSSTSDLTAHYRILHDLFNLYVLIEVEDDIFNDDSPFPWHDDSVEIYIDADLSRGQTYDTTDDRHYIFRRKDASLTNGIYTRPIPSGSVIKSVSQSNGYVVEMSFPLSGLNIDPLPGTQFGLDIQINDDDSPNPEGRDTSLMWNASVNQAWASPSVFGIGEFEGQSTSPTQTPLPPTATRTPTATANPPTATRTPTATANPPTATRTPTAPPSSTASAPTPTSPPSGACVPGITQEVWTGFSTQLSSIDELRNDPRYPNNPSSVATLSQFETPTNWAEGYGQRVRGFVKPSVSGAYRFWIASDDNSELWLSTNGNSANAVKIAHVTDINVAPRNWDTTPTQASASINLVAGQTYYIEAMHVEGYGGDHLSVAWQPPSGTRQVISNANLCVFQAGGSTTPTPTPTKTSTPSKTPTRAATAAPSATSTVIVSNPPIRKHFLPILSNSYPPNNHSRCTAMPLLVPARVSQPLSHVFNMYSFRAAKDSYTIDLSDYTSTGKFLIYHVESNRCQIDGTMIQTLIGGADLNATPSATYDFNGFFSQNQEYLLVIYTRGALTGLTYTLNVK
jgi:hypothetical protein